SRMSRSGVQAMNGCVLLRKMVKSPGSWSTNLLLVEVITLHLREFPCDSRFVPMPPLEHRVLAPLVPGLHELVHPHAGRRRPTGIPQHRRCVATADALPATLKPVRPIVIALDRERLTLS